MYQKYLNRKSFPLKEVPAQTSAMANKRFVNESMQLGFSVNLSKKEAHPKRYPRGICAGRCLAPMGENEPSQRACKRY